MESAYMLRYNQSLYFIFNMYIYVYIKLQSIYNNIIIM